MFKFIFISFLLNETDFPSTDFITFLKLLPDVRRTPEVFNAATKSRMPRRMASSHTIHSAGHDTAEHI